MVGRISEREKECTVLSQHRERVKGGCSNDVCVAARDDWACQREKECTVGSLHEKEKERGGEGEGEGEGVMLECTPLSLSLFLFFSLSHAQSFEKLS